MSTAIHDLGYEPYRGRKTPHGRRFWVIARNAFDVAWRSRWGVRIPLYATIATTVAGSAILFVLRNKLFEQVRRHGMSVPRAQSILFNATSFYELAAFILTAVAATAAVANDLRMGAFQFYFSRPIRPRDYVTGKLLGLSLLVAIPMLSGPVVLATMMLVLSDTWQRAGEMWPFVPRALAFGAFATLAHVLPAAGLGALLRKRQPAQALYAIYYLLVANAAVGLSIPLRFPWLRLIAIQSDVEAIAAWCYHERAERGTPPAWAAACVLGALIVVSFGVVWNRVARAETAGLGQS